MGALPNTLPTTPRKSPSKASKPTKLNQYKRDPESPSEKMRVSDYDKPTANGADHGIGYAPFFHSLWADIPRLSSGNTCTILIGIAFAKSWGRGAAPKSAKAREGFWDGVEPGKRPEWSTALPLDEWAQLCRCDVRQVERVFTDLQKRKIAEVKKAGKGSYSVRLLIRDWEALPDYKSDIVEMPASEDPVELTDEKANEPGNQRVTGKKPVRLAAGATSKPYQVTAGVREYQARVEGPVDCEVSAVIQAGRFVTVVRFPDDWKQKVADSLKASNGNNELDTNLRHGRREDKAKVSGKPARVDHPRAGELSQLFDPLLGKSGAVLLAMDAVSLRAACEAVADCDHHDLVKFVMNRAGRGKISKPEHVAIICGEALASSRAGKIITSAGLPVKSNRGTPAERAIAAAKEKARWRLNS